MLMKIVVGLFGMFWVTNQTVFVQAAENIVGTRKAKYKEFPYAVVFVSHSSNKVIAMGSVVTPEKVLSAVHCFNQLQNGMRVQMSPSTIRAIGGSRFTAANEVGYETREVKKIKTHPEVRWLENTMLNDISIVLLATPFSINDYIQPLRVFSRSTDVFRKKWYSLGESRIECDGLRYGAVPSTSAVPFVNDNTFLKATRIRFLSQEECQELYPEINEDYRKDFLYCATSKYSNESMCVGDPGSSLQCDGLVFAIFIKSVGCGEHNAPALYMSLENYIIMYNLSGQNVILNSFLFTLVNLFVTLTFY